MMAILVDKSQMESQARLATSEMKSVSVVIPFSKLETVGNAIESVLAQDYPSDLVEIIVVGKGSSNLKEKWPKIITVDKGPIFRPGKARNLGAAKAAGDVLLFLDDDCEAQEGWIEANIAELRNDEIGAVSGMILGRSSNYFAQGVDFANFSLCQVQQRQERPICTATFAIRNDVFTQIGGFDESMKVHEDIDICHRLELAGYKNVYQPRVKVFHDHRRTTFTSLIRYLYYGGKEGGLSIEAQYKEQSAFYQILLKFRNPILYSLLVIPFAIGATLRAIQHNIKEHKKIILLSPAIFVGKLSCQLGICHALWRPYIGSQAILREFKRLIEYTFFKRGFKTPRVITLFVTSRCNAKCGHCFYWKNLNQNDDLTFAEIDELSEQVGKVDVLLLTGGEPFLRRDLPEICELFFERNDLGALTIPTNGLQPKTTYKLLRRILMVSRGRPVHLALSIDGTQQIHDEIRGVPGNFLRAVETFQTVSTLKDEFPNLQLRINSTVCSKNLDDLSKLYDELNSYFPGVNVPSISILRGSPYDRSFSLPTEEEIRVLVKDRNRLSPGDRSFLSRLLDNLIFELDMATLRKRKQVVPCEAGRILGVIEDNGNVRHCELLPPIGNLRQKSFIELWNSEHARIERQKIVDGECHCTHECFIYPSLLAHPFHVYKGLIPG
jgi:MoaA/NifB/PqqE/SkfB family radical SAM enzyme/GT2 family glycosyltransferase